MLDRVEYLLRKLQELYVLSQVNKSELMKLPRQHKQRLAELEHEVRDIQRKLGGSEKRRLKARAVELGMEKLV
jgi:hypothetical protein